MRSDDPLEQLAALRTIAPDPEWEKRVRARCHARLSRRPRRMPKLSVIEVAAMLLLGLYLSALLREAARLSGWL